MRRVRSVAPWGIPVGLVIATGTIRIYPTMVTVVVTTRVVEIVAVVAAIVPVPFVFPEVPFGFVFGFVFIISVVIFVRLFSFLVPVLPLFIVILIRVLEVVGGEEDRSKYDHHHCRQDITESTGERKADLGGTQARAGILCGIKHTNTPLQEETRSVRPEKRFDSDSCTDPQSMARLGAWRTSFDSGFGIGIPAIKVPPRSRMLAPGNGWLVRGACRTQDVSPNRPRQRVYE
jgi:hypothetical protein